MKKITEIFIDLNGREEKSSIVNVKRTDTGRSVRVNVLNEGSPYNLTNTTSIQFGCKKANNGKVLRTPAVTFIDKAKGVFSFDFLSTDIDVTGKSECEIILTDTDGVVTTGTFYIYVFAKAIDGSDLLTSSEYNDFEEQYNRLMGLTASDISFDSTGTGLTATNVQEAYNQLDELYKKTLADYNKVFQEVDKHRQDLIAVLNQKNVPTLSTATLGTISENTNKIKGTNPNIFIQSTQPEGFNGIWIKRNSSFRYEILTMSAYNPSLTAEYGNAVIIIRNDSENNYYTKLFNHSVANADSFGAFKVGFNKVYYRYNGTDYATQVYYGDGQAWNVVN